MPDATQAIPSRYGQPEGCPSTSCSHRGQGLLRECSPGVSASRAKPALTDSPFPVCVLSTSVISAGHSTFQLCTTEPDKWETGVPGRHRLASQDPAGMVRRSRTT